MNSEDSFDGLYNSRILKAVDVTANCKGIRNANGGLPSIKPPSVLVRAFSVDEPKPGAPSCSPADSKKYFGGGARDDFFKRNKWLGRQLKITEVRKSGSPTPHLYFDSTDADENYETPVKRHSSISSYKKDTYVSSLFNGESSDGNSVCVNNANNFTPTNSIIKYSGLVKSPVLNAESAFLTNLDQTPGSNQISGDYDSVLTEESQQSLWLEPVDGNMPLSRIEQENTNFDDSGELFDISVCRGADRGKALAAILGRRDHNISTPNPEKDLLAQGSSAQVLDCLAIPHSPRTAYLVGCASEQVLPRPSLLLRKELTTELNLKHQGMGNTRAGIIADSIRALPGIETLNLQDNNLTCHGLCAMFEAIRTASSFTSLDIADNKLGKASSAALADYLASRSCHLKKLGLRNADVSDEECERFVSVIQENPNLLELDMSHNDLGGAEGLNSVLPDIVTAGEALGTLLMDRNCSLQVLNVSWNKIRLGGAEALVRSIGMNKSLLHLDMSYNSLSTKGGILLGAALADNHSLRLLNISNNSIDEIACFTICQSIILNDSLEEVYMDGNPIGEQGAKSLMLVALSIRQPLTAFSAKNCNASIKDPRCSFITPITAGASGKPQYFDCEYPMGSYELYLDYPFHRAIALALLDIASRHVGFVIKNATYEPAGACWEKSGGQAATKIGAVEHLEFITMFSTERSKHLSPSESDVLQYFEMCLKLLQDREAVMHHFYDMADTREGSDVAYASDSESSDEGVENREYELGRLEFFSLMHKIGFNRMTMSEVDDILLLYDLDGSNSIGLEEFLEYVENEEEILEFKIKNLVRQPITVFAGDNGKNNDGNCLKYVPPSTGILRFEVRDGLMKKPVYKVLSVWDSTEVVSMARKTDSTTMAMLFAAKFSKLRLDEAVQLFNAAYKEKQMSRAAILTHLLPSVEDPAEARRLLYIGTEGDRMELQQVRKRLGYLLNVILAQYDGYYHLDLRNENDRTCLSRFIALSDEINERRKAMCPLKSGLVGDYSQHGNWTCFRNETVNSNPVEITSHTFQPCPVRGIVEFDFISGERPKKKYLPMSDKRFFGVLQSACLMNEMHVEQAREHISDLKKQNEMSSYGDGRCVANSVDEERGTAIFKAMEMFHDNISKRHEGFARAVSDVLGSGTGAGSSTRPSTTAGGGRRRLPSTAGGGAVTPRRNPGSESAPAPDSSGKQVPEENTKNAVPILPNIDLATGQSPAVLRTDRPKSSGRPKSSARPRTGGKKRLRNISRVYHIDEKYVAYV